MSSPSGLACVQGTAERARRSAERRARAVRTAVPCAAPARPRAGRWDVTEHGGGYNRASGIFGRAPCVAFLTSGTANNSSNNSLGSGPRRANRTTDSVV